MAEFAHRVDDEAREKYTQICQNWKHPALPFLGIIIRVAKRFHPISFLKSNTADVAKELAEETEAIVITHHGVPSFVCVSFEHYYQMQETNALVKLVNMGERERQRGEFKTLADARSEPDQRILKNRARRQTQE